MTHPLRSSEAHRARAIGRPFACVTVKVVGLDVLEVVAGSIAVFKSDALIVELPERFRVLDEEGREIPAGKHRCFWISTESFNPYHLLACAPRGSF